MNYQNNQKGFTLIETLIGAALFVIISAAIYFSYSNILDISVAAQLNSSGLAVVDNELEIIRNLPYDSVGIVGGAPAGILLAQKTVNYGTTPFLIKTFVRNIDDSFDGTIGGNPNDTAPADYKLVELNLTCPTCRTFINATVTTTVAPKNLEIASKNGSLFVNVFNASGQPVTGADVSVVNNKVIPHITVNDTTNLLGQLQLVDVATSSFGYQIVVSGTGYSTERTYTPGLPANPNPTKPDATVAKQQLTILSFSVDKVSKINLASTNKFCVGVPSIDYSLTGTKLIGTNPNILKYSSSSMTDASGNKAINNIEWDNYNLSNTDGAYEIAGMSVLPPFIVNPDTTTNISWVVEPKAPSSLLVTVKDQNGALVNGASVSLTAAGFSSTKLTNRDTIFQTDWSGVQYTAQSGKISAGSQLTLQSVGGKYPSMSLQWLESSTFDLGTSNATFYRLRWNPTSQPPQSGADSLKFQIATNNDNLTWNYIGPDGTANSYYTSATGTQLHASHNGSRYLRYKAFLRTDNHSFTPTLDDVTLDFSSTCLTNGQAHFSGLANGNYTLLVQKQGFQNLSVPISISSQWQEYRATVTP